LVCVGASAFSAGIFWNDCTMSTTTFRYWQIIAVTT